ncbi:MAG: hypothetical protein N2316_07265 [Spirochaetes bacterium]|nr:hypothetical protein [Spirochaetota bacterium]
MQIEMAEGNIIFIFVLVIFIWVILYMVVLGLISIISGWNRFSKIYPFDGAHGESAHWFSFQTVVLRFWISYRFCIRILVSDKGIAFFPLGIFRFMHRPFCIRWEEIQRISRKSVFLLQGIEMITKHGKIFVSGKSAQEIFTRAQTKKELA